MSALFLGPNEIAALNALRARAIEKPVHMPVVMEQIKTAKGKAAHMDRMTAQTVRIPVGYLVTFSIETGHPPGTCRHMSMSTSRKGKVPNEHAVWIIASALGFWGDIRQCAVWLEDLSGHGKAINLVQPLSAPTPATIQ